MKKVFFKEEEEKNGLRLLELLWAAKNHYNAIGLRLQPDTKKRMKCFCFGCYVGPVLKSDGFQ